jgi:hypothetical protein
MSLSAPVVTRARELAREAHAHQLRKDGLTPYFAHLESVARILSEHGIDDERLLAAAYLHDLIEDQPDAAHRMRREMPGEVVEIVERLTERKLDEHGHKRDKRARFQDYVEGLRSGSDAARAAVVVSCADKIDNVRSLIAAEQERPGQRSLLRSLSTRPGEHRLQLHALREVYAPVVPAALLATFDAAREELERLLRTWVLGHAVSLAADAHVGQLDKAGRPYIEHPLRLMMRATSDEAKMAAVLHDVIEDSPWTLEALAREGIPRRVLRALEHLTKRDGERYEDFIERVAEDKLATRVKILDLEDNADLSRLSAPTEKDLERVAKYERALARLRPEGQKRSLYVMLDDASRRTVLARAVHPERFGDHVTIAFRVDPATYDPSWVPGSPAIGARIAFRAVGHAKDERVQAYAVEIAGTTTRPRDGGILHVTVSVALGAEPSESNELLARERWEPCDLALSGTLEWVE